MGREEGSSICYFQMFDKNAYKMNIHYFGSRNRQTNRNPITERKKNWEIVVKIMVGHYLYKPSYAYLDTETVI